MSFVDDNCERSAAMLASDLFEDIGELLDRRNDDLLTALDEPTKTEDARQKLQAGHPSILVPTV